MSRAVFVLCEPAVQAKIQWMSTNIQQYYALKCLISYLLSNCFDSEFCKHIWTKRKLARRVVWHVVCDEWEGVFWLVEKTCQSGSFNWMNYYLFKSCHFVHLPVSPNLLKIQLCSVQYRFIFALVIWTLLRELDNKVDYTYSTTRRYWPICCGHVLMDQYFLAGL